jgi:predicted dehydrogenase
VHKAVVIGMGVMGSNHYRLLSGMRRVQVVAVCDPVRGSDSGAQWYDSLESLLAEQKPDFAVIAVPTPAHADTAVRCAEAGLHLLIEKPVAADVAGARRIQEVVRRAGVRAAVGHVERFNPVVQALRREVAEKRIFSINFTRVGHMPPRIADVGVLSDLAVHDIDLLRFITGKRILHTTVRSSRRINDHHEDNANISMELENGVLATVTTNWLTPFKRRRIEVTTEGGYFEADLIAQELAEYSAYKDDDTFLTRACTVKKGEPLAGELAAFVSYLDNGEPGDLASVEDGIITLNVAAGGGS